MRERDNQNFSPFLPLLLLRRILHFLIQPSFHIFLLASFSGTGYTYPQILPWLYRKCSTQVQAGKKRDEEGQRVNSIRGKRGKSGLAIQMPSIFSPFGDTSPLFSLPYLDLRTAELGSADVAEEGKGGWLAQGPEQEKKRRTGSIGRAFDDFRKMPNSSTRGKS